MRKNRGQGMSTNTIILLVLGLIVLAVLSIGFMSGWKAFQGESGKTNVDEIVEECQSICSLNQKFSFCSAERELRFAEEDVKIKTSCAVLASEPSLKMKYGIKTCPRVDCKKPCAEIRVEELYAEKLSSEPELYLYNLTSLASDLALGEGCYIL